MFNRELTLKRIHFVFAFVQQYIHFEGVSRFFDAHIVAEDFVKDVLNILFGYHLKNVNAELREGYVSIDLRDTQEPIAFQVTSERDSDKVQETLDKFKKNKLHKQFPRICFFMLEGRQSQYTLSIPKGMKFDWEKDIFDFERLVKLLKGIDDDRIQELKAYLDREVKGLDSPTKAVARVQTPAS